MDLWRRPPTSLRREVFGRRMLITFAQCLNEADDGLLWVGDVLTYDKKLLRRIL